MKLDPRASFATKLVGLYLDKYSDGSFYIKWSSVYVSGNTAEKDDKKYATTAVTCWYNQQEVQFTLYEPLEGHYYGLKPSAFYNYKDANSLKQKDIDDEKWKDVVIKERGLDPIFAYQTNVFIRLRDELAPERYNKTSDYYNKVEALTLLVAELPLLKTFLTSGKKPSSSTSSSEPVSLFSKPFEALSNTGKAFKEITTDVALALKNRIDHICKIKFETKGTGYKFTGCHSKVALDALGNNARIEITIPKNAEGVYEAKVFAKGTDGIVIPKTGNGGKSTFFPDSWDEARILDEVEYAVRNNKGLVPQSAGGASNQYYGFSKDGKIKIEFYYNESTGAINSFFPSLKTY